MSLYIKRIIAYGSILTVLVVTLFAARQPIVQYATNVVSFVKEYTDAHEDTLEQLREEIFSRPLRSQFTGPANSLSPVEVIRLTNIERMNAGVPALERNVLLDQAAADKLQDMFDKQYFDHISPEGKGPGYVAEQAGYSYVIVGENLAMGSFKDDEALVQAWMDSEGHRENILNKRYLEIGVAIGRGMFNGERVWIAVQEFGKPTDVCPPINPELRASIEKNRATVTALNQEIIQRKKELDTMPHDSPEDGEAYNKKVTEYNQTVSYYNTEIAKLKKQIDTYNQEVRNFNDCAQE